jgi:hypothetical protein
MRFLKFIQEFFHSQRPNDEGIEEHMSAQSKRPFQDTLPTSKKQKLSINASPVTAISQDDQFVFWESERPKPQPIEPKTGYLPHRQILNSFILSYFHFQNLIV